MRHACRPPSGPARALLLVVVAALLTAALPSPQAQGSVQGVPEDLTGQARDVATGLDHLAQAQNVSHARALLTGLLPEAYRLVDPAQDLERQAGDLLAGYLEQMEAAATTGDAGDLRSLARAARGVVNDPLQSRFEAWERNRTAIVVGQPTQGEDGTVTLPVVLHSPPPGGIGAFDLRVRVGPGAQLVDASIATGRGEAVADPANGTARLASFDAQALSGLSAQHPRTVLGHVHVSGNATVEVDVDIIDVVDGQGRSVPTLGIQGHPDLAAAGAGQGAWSPWLLWGGLGAVAVLTVVAANRLLEV